MSRVTALDATGAHVLGEAINHLERRGATVLLSGIRAQHDEIIAALGIAEHLRRDGLLVPDTPTAIAHGVSVPVQMTAGGPPSAGSFSARIPEASGCGAGYQPTA